MSRIGKKPVLIPKSVQVDLNGREVRVKGPKGESQFRLPELVELEVGGESIQVKADYINNKRAKSLMGTTQAVIQNMVTGVSEGFSRQLRLVGVGYRAKVSGRTLEMTLGFSKPVQFELPQYVAAEVESNTLITLTCHDKVVLGQTCAQIRAFRPPEPYQSKGVLYAGERVRRKAGKSGKKL